MNNNEQNKFFFKCGFDALAFVNARAEEANNKYDDLANRIETYTVLSNPMDGRTSQSVNISTFFGTENPGDPSVKEFTFNEGSVLRYKRTLPINHTDEYEVVNFKTLMNVLSSIGVL